MAYAKYEAEDKNNTRSCLRWVFHRDRVQERDENKTCRTHQLNEMFRFRKIFQKYTTVLELVCDYTSLVHPQLRAKEPSQNKILSDDARGAP